MSNETYSCPKCGTILIAEPLINRCPRCLTPIPLEIVPLRGMILDYDGRFTVFGIRLLPKVKVAK